MSDNMQAVNLPVPKESIKIIVEKVHIEGNGVILLTGPSGCGKGEIAKALCKFLSIPREKHLSMGEILRNTIEKAKKSPDFRQILSQKYGISDSISIFDPYNNPAEVINKANSYKEQIYAFFQTSTLQVTQAEWLEFCVANGLLVPDEWTVQIVEALLENSPGLKTGILILDGYPRTINAAKYLLSSLEKLGIPVIKVLHLFITKEQMGLRALNRKRTDDTLESLERRYQFYIDKVQPCIDYLKCRLGNEALALIDAHQPVFRDDGRIDLEASIHQVTISVMKALGLPGYLLDI